MKGLEDERQKAASRGKMIRGRREGGGEKRFTVKAEQIMSYPESTQTQRDLKMDNTSHQILFFFLLLRLLLLLIEWRHSRRSPIREEAPRAAVPHPNLMKHAAVLLLVVVLLLLSGRLWVRGGVAGVKPAAPAPRPPLRLVMDTYLAALLTQRSQLLLFLLEERTHAVAQ